MNATRIIIMCWKRSCYMRTSESIMTEFVDNKGDEERCRWADRAWEDVGIIKEQG